MMRKFLRPVIFGCGLIGLVAWILFSQLSTAGAEQMQPDLEGTGTVDNPYAVERLEIISNRESTQNTRRSLNTWGIGRWRPTVRMKVT